MITSAGIFYACKKDNNVVNQRDINKHYLIGETEESITIVEISDKGLEGSGRGKDKTCVTATKRCWIWFPPPPPGPGSDNGPDVKPDKPDDPDSPWIIFKSTGFVSKNGTGNEIILDFKYRNNTVERLSELFNLTERVFVIEEDIVEEEDSYLLELMGTTLPCTIPAGSYPITISTGTDGGIKVILPVIY